MEERTRGVLRSAAPVLVDVGGPLAVFGVLRLGGVATVPALVGAGSVSVVTLVVTVVRERRVSAQTVLVALLVAAGLGLTLVTHDPRLLLVKASVVFAVVGSVMLASCRRGRPLFYGYLEPLAAARHPEGAAGFAAGWAEVPRFRFLLRRMTAVWGATWLVESVLRVVIVYAFPLERVGAALVVATVAIPVLLTPATVVSARDGRELQRLGEARASAWPDRRAPLIGRSTSAAPRR
ncbi:VC0807 family protein [Actinomycetospora sp. CA-053990]|uniref:VC0807 family protein n=1 Tax=Actinomycetospora sp. CA-053990 TaxID=3239891 RepID=UPI003D94B791